MNKKELKIIKKAKSWKIDRIFVGNYGQILIKRDYFGKIDCFRVLDSRRMEIKTFYNIQDARLWLASY